ncbi:MAG: undecaprenyldiphospho-muramoylpentapeptide beta-N-acetylglucosaminyltransferase [Gammaproteobacteria bacterium]|nr:MAG: undecaprenyldiphospho-muramoylpentapeptide beta-N-acetylglucosaminyltransferase [Gammaproteobacteria bacterium]
MARIMIMAGGTGGHVFPALAVARELRSRGWDVKWMGTPDSFEARTVPAAGFDLETVQAHRLRGQGAAGLILAPFRLLHAIGQAWRVLRRSRPDVVLGMGGFVTAPGGIASWLRRTPLVIHEQNTIPGMANRLLSHLARRVLEAFPGSFPVKTGAVVTGNPVRQEILEVEAPQTRMAGRGETRRILVLGGSLGAQALNETVPLALGQLERSLEIRHQAGRGKAEAARGIYVENSLDAQVSEFIDDMAEAYGWADLVICRAGALTVSELAAVGVGAVLVPYPHAVDDHQTANARYLVEGGAARLLPQSEMDAPKLRGMLESLLADRDELLEMARAARRLGRREATRQVADHCVECSRS